MKRQFLMILSIVLLAFTPLMATAQGMPPMPATPVPGEAPVGILAEFDIDELPTPHAEVWFIRMGLDPDGSVMMGKQAGPSILYVESGDLTMIADGAVTMGPGAATPIGATSADAQESVLAAGTSALVEPGTGMGFRNDGDDDATFLVFLMFSAEMEGMDQQEYPEPVGLKQGGISIGTAEFMPMAAKVTIERVVIEPGDSVEPDIAASEMEMPVYLGMELGAVETGSAEVDLEYAGMSNIVWPGMLKGEMGGPGGRNTVALTSTVQLETGDAYAFHGSTLTWRATGDEPLTVLRVVIMPEIPMQ